MMRGNISTSEAVGNIARDTAVSYGFGYLSGAISTGSKLIGSAIGRTATGKAIGTAVSSATTVLEGTAIGGAITSSTAAISGLATATTAGAVGVISSTGAAIGSALTTATAGTAIGGAVASGVGAAAVGSFISSFFD